jgi:hypothetical protein
MAVVKGYRRVFPESTKLRASGEREERDFRARFGVAATLTSEISSQHLNAACAETTRAAGVLFGAPGLDHAALDQASASTKPLLPLLEKTNLLCDAEMIVRASYFAMLLEIVSRGPRSF